MQATESEEKHTVESDGVNMMLEQQDEKDAALIKDAYVYITTSAYPEDCPESTKRVIRKKCKKFQVTEGEL